MWFYSPPLHLFPSLSDLQKADPSLCSIFVIQKILKNFIRSHLLVVLSGFSESCSQVLSCANKSSSTFPTFSSIKFRISGLILRSLMYLDLSFVQSERWEIKVEFFSPTYNYLYVDQQYLLKMPIFSNVYHWLLSKNHLTCRSVDFCVGSQSYVIDLFYMPVQCCF